MASVISKIFKGDRTLWVVLALLSLVSIVIVYSATGKLAFKEADGNTARFLLKQLSYIMGGFLLMILLVNIIPVHLYFKFSPLLIGVTVLLLIVAYFQFSSGSDKETSRSLNLVFFSFQPAELAKISLVMFAARVLSKSQQSDTELKNAFVWVTSTAGIICFIIFLSNISTSIIIFLSIMVLMMIARISFKLIGLLSLSGIILAVLLFFTADYLPKSFGRVHTGKQRIIDHIYGDKEASKGTTQADYATLAVFEGGWFGKGPGNSEVSNYMEAGYNDFIFAIFIEEYGFVGGIILVLLYLILLFRGVAIVRKCNRTFPAFLVAGLVVLLVFQAFINMAVSVGVAPVTGQPLPWVSMGGSSLLFTAFSFGIILSVSALNQADINNSAEGLAENQNGDQEI